MGGGGWLNMLSGCGGNPLSRCGGGCCCQGGRGWLGGAEGGGARGKGIHDELECSVIAKNN